MKLELISLYFMMLEVLEKDELRTITLDPNAFRVQPYITPIPNYQPTQPIWIGGGTSTTPAWVYTSQGGQTVYPLTYSDSTYVTGGGAGGSSSFTGFNTTVSLDIPTMSREDLEALMGDNVATLISAEPTYVTAVGRV